MTFFVDANVLIYSAVSSDFREPCLEVLEAIARGQADGRTSAAVLEEVWHIERSGRAGNLEGLARRAYTLMTPLLPVDDDAFRLALALEASELGTNDRLHVGTCMSHGIEIVLSADEGFDSVREVRRIDPLNSRARRRLLAPGR